MEYFEKPVWLLDIQTQQYYLTKLRQYGTALHCKMWLVTQKLWDSLKFLL